MKVIKVEHHKIENTPFGIQETFICDAGHIEIWGSEDTSEGYHWRFTSEYQFPTSDNKTYRSRLEAINGLKEFLDVELESKS